MTYELINSLFFILFLCSPVLPSFRAGFSIWWESKLSDAPPLQGFWSSPTERDNFLLLLYTYQLGNDWPQRWSVWWARQFLALSHVHSWDQSPVEARYILLLIPVIKEEFCCLRTESWISWEANLSCELLPCWIPGAVRGTTLNFW